MAVYIIHELMSFSGAGGIFSCQNQVAASIPYAKLC